MLKMETNKPNEDEKFFGKGILLRGVPKQRSKTVSEASPLQMVKQIMHEGALRTESDSVWTDNWNFGDEVAYRKKHRISMHFDRCMDR